MAAQRPRTDFFVLPALTAAHPCISADLYAVEHSEPTINVSGEVKLSPALLFVRQHFFCECSAPANVQPLRFDLLGCWIARSSPGVDFLPDRWVHFFAAFATAIRSARVSVIGFGCFLGGNFLLWTIKIPFKSRPLGSSISPATSSEFVRALNRAQP
jgi:hypothetical protein